MVKKKTPDYRVDNSNSRLCQKKKLRIQEYPEPYKVLKKVN